MVNNFDIISNFINVQFPDGCWDADKFWHIQIMLRHKDNPNMVNELNTNKGNTNRMFMDVFIRDGVHLKENEEFISRICDSVGARAYINLSPKSYKKAAKQAGLNMIDAICTDNWKAARTAYKSAVAKSSMEKLYMIDVDEKSESVVNYMLRLVEKSKNPQDTRPNLHLATIPTKNGFHIICKPFNCGSVMPVVSEKGLEAVEIKKDALTLLYYGGE